MKLITPHALPEQVLRILQTRGNVIDPQNQDQDEPLLTVNNHEDIAFRFYGFEALPCVLWHKGRIEVVESQPSRTQSAADLYDYPEIVKLARAGVKKDEITCRWVNTIHDLFVLRLLTKAYHGHLPKETLYYHRGMIEQAKFTVLRIWRMGVTNGNST